MRSMWKGAISFGLVMIPVKLYAATEQKDIAFRQVHEADGGRIRFRRICSVDGLEVPYEEIAKGYELPDGEMIVLTDEDFAELPLPTTKSIEVTHFTPAEQLDPILFNRSYYIEPETTGTRAYALLRDALERSDKVAIAQVALRQRESLATLRTREGVLVLETLLWPDEVRAVDFPFLHEDVEVRSQELRMATSLIDSMTVDFDPEEYHDRYREALQELIAAKTEGREVMQPEVAEEAGAPASLADALRASLAAARGEQSQAPQPRSRAAARSSESASQDGKAADRKAQTNTKRVASSSSTRTRSGPTASAAKDGARATSRRPAKEPAQGTDSTDETAVEQKAGRRKAPQQEAGQQKAAPQKGAAKEPAPQRRTRRRAS